MSRRKFMALSGKVTAGYAAGLRGLESGWKDTVALESGDEVKLIMRFDGYRGRYLLHCHNLEHEDRGMMARFDVV